MSSLTITQMKSITKSLKKYADENRRISGKNVQLIAQRHNNVTWEDVNNIAASLNYFVIGGPPKTTTVKERREPVTVNAAMLPSAEAQTIIRQAGLYRQVGGHVVIRKKDFEKEREALKNWIKALGGDWPEN